MVFLPRTIHIDAGGSTGIDLPLSAPPLNLRSPLILESEKKCDRDGLARAYREALARHLGGACEADDLVTPLAAQSQCLKIDLFELAGIHEAAIRKVLAGHDCDADDEQVRRGKAFFAEVVRAGEMRGHAEMIGGAFKLDSHPGNETTISVEIPSPQPPRT